MIVRALAPLGAAWAVALLAITVPGVAGGVALLGWAGAAGALCCALVAGRGHRAGGEPAAAGERAGGDRAAEDHTGGDRPGVRGSRGRFRRGRHGSGRHSGEPGARLGLRLRAHAPLLAVCLSAGALVATTATVQAPLRQPPVLLEAAQGAHTVALTGTVLSTPVARPAPRGGDRGESGVRVSFALRAEQLDRPGAGDRASPARLAVPLLAFAELPADSPWPEIGSRVQLQARLHANPPGEQDAFLAFGTSALEQREAPPWFLNGAAGLRGGFRAAAVRLPGEGGALLPGLAIGDTTAVGEQLDQNMKASALSHLTAVSGANCVLVVAAVMLLGAVLGLRRRARIGLALAALAGFVVLVTPEPSVLRAGVMAVIVLFGLAAGRPGGGVPALGLACLVLLALDPWLAASYGFALSALATAGLLLLTAPLAALLGRWMPHGVALALAMPLAAQLACEPVLIMLNPSVSLLGVPANLLAAPAAPVATLLGLAACLLLPVLPSLGFALAQLAWLPAAWIAAVAGTVAAAPWARLPWLEGVLGAVLLAAVTALALVVLLRRGRGEPGEPGARGRRGRPAGVLFAVASTTLLVVLGGYGGALLGSGVVRGLARPADWQIALCDVGQGDAVLVREAGRVLLIDTGPDAAALRRCLGGLGVDRIDVLVLTHYDRDHVGGVEAVRGRIDAALVGTAVAEADRRLLALLAAEGASVRQARRGDTGMLGELAWRVLWPAATSGEQAEGNAGSVVLETSASGIRAVFLGDLGEESERALLALEKPGTFDIVKVAHHGSSDQEPRLYGAFAAKLGLIGVGADNGYGHPTPALLGMLEKSGTRAFRSDLHGLVLVSVRGGALRVWTERDGG